MSTNASYVPGTAPAKPGSERFHDLDALRAVAMILGILYHLTLSFGAVRGEFWIVQDRSASWAFDVFAITSHGFRMPLFFLIAGFFACLVVLRKGAAPFLSNRARRIVLPLLLAIPVMLPLLQFIKHFATTGTAAGFQTWWPDLGAGTHHLWFLIYLVPLYVGAVGAAWTYEKLVPQGLKQFVRNTVNGLLQKPMFLVALLSVVTFVALTRMHRWGVDPEYASAIPQVRILGYYALFFAVGWVLYCQRHLLAALVAPWKVFLLLAIPLGAILCTTYPLQLDEATAGSTAYKMAHKATLAVYVWLMILGSIGLFRACFKKSSARARWIADSSYWLYLAHMPLVMVAQLMVADLPGPVVLKFILTTGVVLGILFVSYRYCVRYTWLGSLLNGPRKRLAKKTPVTAPTPVVPAIARPAFAETGHERTAG